MPASSYEAKDPVSSPGTRRPRIVVYSIGNLGDTIASVPALKLIRRKYGPEYEIYLFHDFSPEDVVSVKDVLSGTGLVDIYVQYARVKGFFQRVLSFVTAWWRITRLRFEAVVYLMQSERSARGVRRDRLFFSFCGIPEKLAFEAFSKEFLYPRDTNGVPMLVEHEALRRAKRLSRFGFGLLRQDELDDPFLELPELDVGRVRAWLQQNRRYPERTLIAFCPSSKMTAKLWPEERFVEIGRRLLSRGEFEIVVIGGNSDVQFSESLINQWGSGLNAAGVFSILGSAALLRLCRFSVTLDSGPMHLAAAVGTPCVALFSSVDYPGRFHPLGRGHILFRHSVPCAGCRLQKCPVEGHPCMTGIDIEEVWRGVEEMCSQLDLPLSMAIKPLTARS